MSELLYISLAILSGFFTALSDVLSKDYMNRTQTDSLFALYVRWVFCSISLIPLIFVDPIPKIDLETVALYLILFPLEILAGYLYMKSLEVSESTLVLPFQSFTPVFIPPIAVFIIGESYSTRGLIGIALVVIGSFLFFKDNGSRKISDKRGILYMLASAIIYALTSVLGRYLILKVSPFFFSVSYMSALCIILTPYFTKKYKGGFSKIKSSLKPSFILGFTTALAVITHFVSVMEIETGYMIAFKRTSVIFSVVLGYLMLSEKTDLKERLAGSLIMTLGIFLIGVAIT